MGFFSLVTVLDDYVNVARLTVSAVEKMNNEQILYQGTVLKLHEDYRATPGSFYVSLRSQFLFVCSSILAWGPQATRRASWEQEWAIKINPQYEAEGIIRQGGERQEERYFVWTDRKRRRLGLGGTRPSNQGCSGIGFWTKKPRVKGFSRIGKWHHTKPDLWK